MVARGAPRLRRHIFTMLCLCHVSEAQLVYRNMSVNFFGGMWANGVTVVGGRVRAGDVDAMRPRGDASMCRVHVVPAAAHLTRLDVVVN
jgi:hypothetical protein